jgi:hypothetical protein
MDDPTQFINDAVLFNKGEIDAEKVRADHELYLYQHKDGDDAKAAAEYNKPMGMGMDREAASRVTRLEVWATTFGHEGDDFSVFVAYGEDGNAIKYMVVKGY